MSHINNSKQFTFLEATDLSCLYCLLKKEHPQVRALILSHLEPSRASLILQDYPQNIQSSIIQRIALMGNIDSNILKKVEKACQEKLSALSNEYSTGGIKNAAMILKYINRHSKIVKLLKIANPKLAKEIIKQR